MLFRSREAGGSAPPPPDSMRLHPFARALAWAPEDQAAHSPWRSRPPIRRSHRVLHRVLLRSLPKETNAGENGGKTKAVLADSRQIYLEEAVMRFVKTELGVDRLGAAVFLLHVQPHGANRFFCPRQFLNPVK